MDQYDYRPRSSHEMGDLPCETGRPQLPNFNDFVRTVGHPDLAYRKPFRPNTASASPQLGQSSLPTPPSTSGNQPSWLPTNRAADHVLPASLAILEDTAISDHDSYRRASFVLSPTARPLLRQSRAYSNTNIPVVSSNSYIWSESGTTQEEGVVGDQRYYVLNDGSMCPKEINGDIVNPKWGVTKAGKPRKRLGQACAACREKKTKCDGPGGSGHGAKCSQCLRYNRECVFHTGSNARQGHRSPKFSTSAHSPATTTTHSPKEYVASRKTSLAPTEASTITDAVCRSVSKSSGTAGDILSPTMSDIQVNEASTPSKKRQRLTSEMSCETIAYRETSNSVAMNDPHGLGLGPDIDPMFGNAKLAKEYLTAFMNFVNVPTYEVFPPSRFMHWALSNTKKSLQDRIMLYAAMAWGTAHSSERDRVLHRQALKLIVWQRLDRLEAGYCLQTVQTLLFLSVAEYLDAEYQKGHSVFSRCIGAIAFLQLNLEPSADSESTAYNFSPAVFAECRRRTYWAVYCTDSYAGLGKGDPRMLHSTDIFLRLPCSNQLYEEDRIPTLPIFDHENVIPKSISTQDYSIMGDMIWLLQIATICGEVQLHSWRCQNAYRLGSQHICDSTSRHKLEARLKEWAEAYSEAIRVTDAGSGDAKKPQGSHARARKFAGLDVLYHYAHMELNRRIHHKDLTERQIVSHAKNATVHAVEVLRLIQQLKEEGESNTRDYIFVTRGPLAGYVIHSAIDIITAAGKVHDILEPKSMILSMMYRAHEIVDNLAELWASARIQQAQVRERIQMVYNSAQAAVYNQKAFFYCSDPMTRVVDVEFDLIYGTNRKQYLRAAYSGSNAIDESQIQEISTKEQQVDLRMSPPGAALLRLLQSSTSSK